MRCLALLLTLATPLAAQTPLHQQIADIAKDAKGTVYVACSLPCSALDCGLNEHGHPAMQSTFKFPLAIAVLQQVEAGKLTLDQQVRFLPSDRYPGSYSPLQDAHPEANVDVTLRDLLRYSAELSDNVATDILLRIVGGPGTVQRSLDQLGLREMHVRDSEGAMHDNHALQYRNYAEPVEMVALLRRLSDRSPLNAEHTALLMQWLTETPTGPKRMKALLPAGTIVAHKTGTAFTENGLTAATNDVGLITLPDGRKLALAIFVSDARADETTRESVIARIAKAIYDNAMAKAH